MPPKRKSVAPRGLGKRKRSRPARFDHDASASDTLYSRTDASASDTPSRTDQPVHSASTRSYSAARQGQPPSADQPHVSFTQSSAAPPASTVPPPGSTTPSGTVEMIECEIAPSTCQSIYDPIGSFVPIKLKEKIWEGKFIDLSLLLKSSREIETEMESAGELVFKNGKMTVHKTTALSALYNISSWTSAFWSI